VIAWLAVVTGIVAIGVLVWTGDLVPAVLYPCTVLIGIALLAGWA
jgi:hypothetical protein